VDGASKGAQEPSSWSSDPPKFYFHQPVSQAPRQIRNGRLNYVYIPAGTFWMGCAPGSAEDCRAEEKPRHLVEISKPFWIGQTEVTVQGYQWFKPNWKPRRGVTNAGRQGDYPAVNLSWEEAQEFCAWTAKGGRLPTEAEWEYAARGGKENEVFPYPDLAASREKANFQGRSGHDRFDELAPVAVFDPNGYKLYDMAGNVWEWVQDWYRADYYRELAGRSAPVRDPQGPANADKAGQHVVRGGSWNSSADTHLRLSFRDTRSVGNNLGFRCVLPDTPEVRGAFVN
jgi:formylglycine-generating enzyme required for sulfatase activity